MEQLPDAFCIDVRNHFNTGDNIAFAIDNGRLLTKTVEAGVKIVIPHGFKRRMLHKRYYSCLSEHPGGRKQYHSTRRYFHWPAVAVDCFTTDGQCPHCTRSRVDVRKHVKKLKPFPERTPLESVEIFVLGELIRTPRGHQYLLVITDRHTKLVRTIPVKTDSALEVARNLVHEWVFNYRPPVELLADNGG